jgi:hypothetical protein
VHLVIASACSEKPYIDENVHAYHQISPEP